MKKLMITLIFTSLIFTQTDGEVVTNVNAWQSTDGSKLLNITYDLETSLNFPAYRIYVSIEDENGNSEYLTVCTGDIWELVYPGDGKEIQCQLDITEHSNEAVNLSGNFFINIYADGYGASDLPDDFEFVNILGGTLYMATLNATHDLPPALDNIVEIPNFEMMKYEVTSLQYVNFLYALLETAVTVENNDVDWGGTNIYGDATGSYRRKYTFEDGRYLEIEWSIDYYGPNGKITGWEPMQPPGSNNNPNNTWITLMQTDSPGPDSDAGSQYPKIEFSGGELFSNNIAFFITEGMANHPVVGVRYSGAMAFAEFYGLTLPSEAEWLYAGYGDYNPIATWDDDMLVSESLSWLISCYSSNDNCYGMLPITDSNGDLITVATLSEMTGGHTNFEIWSEEICEFGAFCNRTQPVGSNSYTSPFGVYDLLGNVSEHLRDIIWRDDSIDCFNCNFSGDGYFHPGVIGWNFLSLTSNDATPSNWWNFDAGGKQWIASGRDGMTWWGSGFRCIKIPVNN